MPAGNAELPPRLRIIFFREQADIVAQRKKALEQCACFGVAMLQLIIIGKPESAREKDAFSGRQAINVRLCSITQHKAVDHELPLDRRDGAAHPWIVCRQKADEGDQQEARVELAVAKALRKGVALAVISKFTKRRMHAVADLPPGFQRGQEVEPLGIAHRAIHGYPRHDLGKSKLAATTSDFPDALVWLLPDLLQM